MIGDDVSTVSKHPEACRGHHERRLSGVVWPVFRRILDPSHQYDQSNPSNSDLKRPSELHHPDLSDRLLAARGRAALVAGLLVFTLGAGLAVAAAEPAAPRLSLGLLLYLSAQQREADAASSTDLLLKRGHGHWPRGSAVLLDVERCEEEGADDSWRLQLTFQARLGPWCVASRRAASERNQE